MPRNSKKTALERLMVIDSSYRSALAGLESLRLARVKAIVQAVDAGNSRVAVGRVVNVTPSRVSVIITAAS